MAPDQFTAAMNELDPLIDAANAAHNAGDYAAEAHWLDEVERALDRLDEARQGGTTRGAGDARA